MSTSAPDDPRDDLPRLDAATPTGEERQAGESEFLVPGPTPESNEGLARWGITWIVFSLLLMLLMLGLTVACYFIGNWLNLG